MCTLTDLHEYLVRLGAQVDQDMEILSTAVFAELTPCKGEVDRPFAFILEPTKRIEILGVTACIEVDVNTGSLSVFVGFEV